MSALAVGVSYLSAQGALWVMQQDKGTTHVEEHKPGPRPLVSAQMRAKILAGLLEVAHFLWFWYLQLDTHQSSC